jgi:hypothetical protein
MTNKNPYKKKVLLPLKKELYTLGYIQNYRETRKLKKQQPKYLGVFHQGHLISQMIKTVLNREVIGGLKFNSF